MMFCMIKDTCLPSCLNSMVGIVVLRPHYGTTASLDVITLNRLLFL